MKIVFSMPGRHGDILWAMPSVRALAETYDQPIDLILSPKYSSLTDLLRLQPYVESVSVDPAWEVREEAPMQPRIPPTPIEADVVVHGGYIGWPSLPLPSEISAITNEQKPTVDIDLKRPWITVPRLQAKMPAIAIGFSDEWYELKYGVEDLVLAQHDNDGRILCGAGSRWATETVGYYCDEGTAVVEHGVAPTTWLEAARIIDRAEIFLGCCSALHVLAVGLGKPCVIMEPNEMRWNPIFWPLGIDGPQVTCVKGGDGKPTFDARHVADTLRQVLDRVRSGVSS